MHVALCAIAAHALDADGTAAEHAGREEVRSRRGIAFDPHSARRYVSGAGGNPEALPSLATDAQAELRHRRQRQLDIRLRGEIALDSNRRGASGSSQRNEESGSELARDVAANRD